VSDSATLSKPTPAPCTSELDRQPAVSASASGKFLRSVASLAGATAVGQALTLLAAPLLTRLYQPSDFGVSSAVVWTLTILGAAAMLKYDWAVPLPPDDRRAASLVCLCLVLLVLGTCGVTLLVALFPTLFSVSAGDLPPGVLLWLPLMFAGTGAFEVCRSWQVRKRVYSPVVVAEIAGCMVTVGTQLLCSLFTPGPAGLLVGTVCGQATRGALAGFLVLVKEYRIWWACSGRELCSVALEFKRFPLFSSPGGILNVAGQAVPILLVLQFYGAEATGFFSVGQRFLGLPMVLVGASVATVFFGEAANRLRTRPAEMLSLYHRATARLALGSLGIVGGAAIAPAVFSLVFGRQWTVSGTFCQYLSLCFAVQFVVSSTACLSICGWNATQLVWDLGRLGATALAFVCGHAAGWGVAATLILYSVVMALCYVVLYGLNVIAICHAAKVP
jgi:O-antigen/teichoic acid export membrane protein